jgi:hypothetical protein
MRYKKVFSRGKRTKYKKNHFKSRLEANFAAEMFKRNLKAEYESNVFAYVRKSHYTPDWKIREGLFIETKGYLSPSNRSNLLSFREQYPNIEIRLAFANASNRLNSRSDTTYAKWAEKNGFKWCDLSKGFPAEWWATTRKDN